MEKMGKKGIAPIMALAIAALIVGSLGLVLAADVKYNIIPFLSEGPDVIRAKICMADNVCNSKGCPVPPFGCTPAGICIKARMIDDPDCLALIRIPGPEVCPDGTRCTAQEDCCYSWRYDKYVCVPEGGYCL